MTKMLILKLNQSRALIGINHRKQKIVSRTFSEHPIAKFLQQSQRLSLNS